MRQGIKIISGLLLYILCIGCTFQKEVLTIYSSRSEPLLRPVLEAFEADTGIQTRTFIAKSGVLIKRIEMEKEQSEADVLMTVDVGNLESARSKGLLARTQSNILSQSIPAIYRANDHTWFGFSLRARTIVYHPNIEFVPQTYQDLADSQLSDKLCLRTSKKVYNQSLVAFLLTIHTEKRVTNLVKSWVQNLEQPIFSSDREVLAAIENGSCHVGVVNSYYYGRALKKNPNLKTKLLWANHQSTGTHVNISGAAIVKHAKNKIEALQFLEWLSSPKAQVLFARLNLEFPVNSKADMDPLWSKMPDYRSAQIPLTAIAEQLPKARQIIADTGYE